MNLRFTATFNRGDACASISMQQPPLFNNGMMMTTTYRR